MAPLKLEISLGAEAHGEELDGQARHLRRELREFGIEADNVRAGLAPEGSKAGEEVVLGQLALSPAPEQFAALVGVLGQWISFDPSRATTLSNIPIDQLALLATLVINMIQRTPNRLARFEYKDGERQFEIEYDPEKTNPQKLLAEIKATAQNTVNLAAQGNITILGNVVGRDLTTAMTSE